MKGGVGLVGRASAVVLVAGLGGWGAGCEAHEAGHDQHHHDDVPADASAKGFVEVPPSGTPPPPALPQAPTSVSAVPEAGAAPGRGGSASGELLAGEARRTTVAALEQEVTLRPHLGFLREHFGRARGPFEVQRVSLADGRTAVLASAADESEPVALVFDRDEIVWSKKRPTAGILAPVQHLALAPRPDGGVALFAWVAPLHLAVSRMWADDSNPFGDFELFAPAACDSLSAAYAPRQGWIVACASSAGTHAQRMREDGTTAWGHDGALLGAPGLAGPATIVFDSASTLILLQRVAAVGGDRLLAFRYDANAEALWPGPSALGTAAPGGAPRLQASLARDGVVRVELPRGLAGNPGARAVEVTSNGQVTLVR